MENEVKKKETSLNNETYKERFQFILSLGSNIICQRYFRINGFNKDSVDSVELKEVLDNVVWLIQKDLISKSRVYQWYTADQPIKLTGFHTDKQVPQETPTYFEYPKDTPNSYADAEKPEPYDYTFKFSYLMDGKTVYERIWDGSEYPRYVRNSVDLTNSDSAYRNKDERSMSFNLTLLRAMTSDKSDLISTIIRKICDVSCSNYTENFGPYTRKDNYGKRSYRLYSFNDEYVSGWQRVMSEKSKAYYISLFPSKRQCEKIEKM